MYAASQTLQAMGGRLGEAGQAVEGRQPEITEQMDLLRGQVASLEGSLTQLLNRIGPVRRTPAPVAGNTANAPTAVPRALQSPMAQSLESVRSDLHSFTRRVEEALYDLELP